MSFQKDTHPHVGWLDDHSDSPGVKKINHEHPLQPDSIVKTAPKDADDATDNRPPSANSSKFVDNITMEFMMNRHHYKKYLAKTDKSKYEETKKRIQILQTYQSDIMNMVNDLIQDYISCGSFSKYNSEINHTFESFMITAIRHLEENPPDNDDEYDTLFNIGTYGSSRP
jgi:hypothetical protein